MTDTVESSETGGAALTSSRETLLQRRIAGAKAAATNAARPSERSVEFDPEEPFPLTELQEAYWIGRSDAFLLGNVAAFGYAELDCMDLDIPRLERAVDRLVERHEMLRAIVQADGLQRVLPQASPYRVQLLDLRSSPDREQQLAQLRWTLSHQVRPADQWPLFDVRATMLDDCTTRLHIGFDTLIADALSFRILATELVALYSDPQRVLPPISTSFHEHVLAAGPPVEERIAARRYWEERIDTLAVGPELQLPRAPGDVDRPRFDRRQAVLPRDDWARVQGRGRERGLTPSGVLLAAFADLLGRWSADERFTITLTLFSRPQTQPDINSVVGPFTTLALVEVDPPSPSSFAERARSVQRSLWKSLEHRAAGGVWLIRELGRRHHDKLRSPVVFTSVLDGEGSVSPQRILDPLGEMVFALSQTPQVLLDHQVEEQDGELHFWWDFVANIFEEGVVDEMFGEYVRFLESLAAPHGDSVWDRAGRWVGPRMPSSTAAAPARLLHDGIVSRSAAECDSPVAVVSAAGGMLTYDELDRRAEELASVLRSHGASRQRLVGVAGEKGLDQVVAIVAALRAQAAYLPLDPGLPLERLRRLLELGEVEVVVAPPGSPLSSFDGVTLIRPDARSEVPVAGEEPHPDDLAYVIFTSGSTGVPKGVAVTHRAARNTIDDINDRFSISADDRVLALSSLSFDLSVWDVFGALAAGGTIVMPAAGARGRDPAHWADLIDAHGITIWNSVPALMMLLLESPASARMANCDGLRLVLLSGDWIPVSLPDRIRARFPYAEVVSLGGATEAGIWSVAYPIREVDPSWPSIPYGKPLRNQSVHVLDRFLESRPVGVPGELYIGGASLASGYWRAPDLSASAFPVQPATGDRLYRTGDFGRTLPDGNLQFLGRHDHQVKLQGHRLELGEVEATLRRHDGLVDAAAVVIGDHDFHRRLVAFVVPEGDSVDERSIHEFARQHLPSYAVPSTVELVEALPLTNNGKVDRRELARRSPSKREPATVATGPRPVGPTAGLIASVVADVLGQSAPDPHENLLDRGADSVDIVRVGNALEARFGFRPDIEAFFADPTIDSLARHLEAALVDQLLGAATRPASTTRSGSKPLIVEPVERARFAASLPAIRNDAGPRMPLPTDASAVAVDGQELSALAALLAPLRAHASADPPRFDYPSAGRLHSVQTYLITGPMADPALDGSVLYHHPVAHALLTLGPRPPTFADAFDPFVYRPIVEQAWVTLLFVFRPMLVARLYGPDADRFAAVEVGAMAQLVAGAARERRLTTQAIFDARLSVLRPHLRVPDDAVMLHATAVGYGPLNVSDAPDPVNAAAASTEQWEVGEL